MAQHLSIDEVRNYDVNGQTFDLVALIEALNETPDGWVSPQSVNELQVGQIVHVWALGDRLRRGVVAKLGRTKATVVFTTQGAVGDQWGRGIRVADTAVQLSQIKIPAAPVAEVTEVPALSQDENARIESYAKTHHADAEGMKKAMAQVKAEREAAPVAEVEAGEFTEVEREELAQDFRVSGALDDAHAEALILGDPETECDLCGGPLASDGACADDMCDVERPEVEPVAFTLTETQIEENAAQSEAENLADAEVARDENEAEGGIYAGTEWVSSPAVQREVTGSGVVKLLERVHERIRQNHPEVPAVVIVTGAGIGNGNNKWGHFRPEGWNVKSDADKSTHIHEMFMAGETLAKGPHQVLQTMLHESAHALAEHRGEQDTSRQGRWHNKVFLKTAQEMGLEHKTGKADTQNGFSGVTLTAATLAEYKDLLDELEAEIHLMVRLPGWLGGQDDEEDQGGESIGRKPKTPAAPSTTNLKLTCTCEEPNIVRASRKVADLKVIRCDDCGDLFEDRS